MGLFEITNLPEEVTATVVDRAELRKVIYDLWYEVFPDRSNLKPEAVSAERIQLRKEVSKYFDEKTLCLDIVFKERTSGRSIGWIMSEQHDYETFYLRNSGFIPEFRRKKIYSISHKAIETYVKGLGFERIVSDHLPNNKPMLLLKINDGYVVNNMTLDDRFGPMVRLVKFLYEDRQKFFEKTFRLPNYSDL